MDNPLIQAKNVLDLNYEVHSDQEQLRKIASSLNQYNQNSDYSYEVLELTNKVSKKIEPFNNNSVNFALGLTRKDGTIVNQYGDSTMVGFINSEGDISFTSGSLWSDLKNKTNKISGLGNFLFTIPGVESDNIVTTISGSQRAFAYTSTGKNVGRFNYKDFTWSAINALENGFSYGDIRNMKNILSTNSNTAPVDLATADALNFIDNGFDITDRVPRTQAAGSFAFKTEYFKDNEYINDILSDEITSKETREKIAVLKFNFDSNGGTMTALDSKLNEIHNFATRIHSSSYGEFRKEKNADYAEFMKRIPDDIKSELFKQVNKYIGHDFKAVLRGVSNIFNEEAMVNAYTKAGVSREEAIKKFEENIKPAFTEIAMRLHNGISIESTAMVGLQGMNIAGKQGLTSLRDIMTPMAIHQIATQRKGQSISSLQPSIIGGVNISKKINEYVKTTNDIGFSAPIYEEYNQETINLMKKANLNIPDEDFVNFSNLHTVVHTYSDLAYQDSTAVSAKTALTTSGASAKKTIKVNARDLLENVNRQRLATGDAIVTMEELINSKELMESVLDKEFLEKKAHVQNLEQNIHDIFGSINEKYVNEDFGKNINAYVSYQNELLGGYNKFLKENLVKTNSQACKTIFDESSTLSEVIKGVDYLNYREISGIKNGIISFEFDGMFALGEATKLDVGAARMKGTAQNIIPGIFLKMGDEMLEVNQIYNSKLTSAKRGFALSILPDVISTMSINMMQYGKGFGANSEGFNKSIQLAKDFSTMQTNSGKSINVFDLFEFDMSLKNGNIVINDRKLQRLAAQGGYTYGELSQNAAKKLTETFGYLPTNEELNPFIDSMFKQMLGKYEKHIRNKIVVDPTNLNKARIVLGSSDESEKIDIMTGLVSKDKYEVKRSDTVMHGLKLHQAVRLMSENKRRADEDSLLLSHLSDLSLGMTNNKAFRNLYRQTAANGSQRDYEEILNSIGHTYSKSEANFSLADLADYDVFNKYDHKNLSDLINPESPYSKLFSQFYNEETKSFKNIDVELNNFDKTHLGVLNIFDSKNIEAKDNYKKNAALQSILEIELFEKQRTNAPLNNKNVEEIIKNAEIYNEKNWKNHYDQLTGILDGDIADQKVKAGTLYRSINKEAYIDNDEAYRLLTGKINKSIKGSGGNILTETGMSSNILYFEKVLQNNENIDTYKRKYRYINMGKLLGFDKSGMSKMHQDISKNDSTLVSALISSFNNNSLKLNISNLDFDDFGKMITDPQFSNFADFITKHKKIEAIQTSNVLDFAKKFSHLTYKNIDDMDNSKLISLLQELPKEKLLKMVQFNEDKNAVSNFFFETRTGDIATKANLKFDIESPQGKILEKLFADIKDIDEGLFTKLDLTTDYFERFYQLQELMQNYDKTPYNLTGNDERIMKSKKINELLNKAMSEANFEEELVNRFIKFAGSNKDKKLNIAMVNKLANLSRNIEYGYDRNVSFIQNNFASIVGKNIERLLGKNGKIRGLTELRVQSSSTFSPKEGSAMFNHMVDEFLTGDRKEFKQATELLFDKNVSNEINIKLQKFLDESKGSEALFKENSLKYLNESIYGVVLGTKNDWEKVGRSSDFGNRSSMPVYLSRNPHAYEGSLLPARGVMLNETEKNLSFIKNMFGDKNQINTTVGSLAFLGKQTALRMFGDFDGDTITVTSLNNSTFNLSYLEGKQKASAIQAMQIEAKMRYEAYNLVDAERDFGFFKSRMSADNEALKKLAFKSNGNNYDFSLNDQELKDFYNTMRFHKNEALKSMIDENEGYDDLKVFNRMVYEHMHSTRGSRHEKIVQFINSMTVEEKMNFFNTKLQKAFDQKITNENIIDMLGMKGKIDVNDDNISTLRLYLEDAKKRSFEDNTKMLEVFFGSKKSLMESQLSLLAKSTYDAYTGISETGLVHSTLTKFRNTISSLGISHEFFGKETNEYIAADFAKNAMSYENFANLIEKLAISSKQGGAGDSPREIMKLFNLDPFKNRTLNFAHVEFLNKMTRVLADTIDYKEKFNLSGFETTLTDDYSKKMLENLGNKGSFQLLTEMFYQMASKDGNMQPVTANNEEALEHVKKMTKAILGLEKIESLNELNKGQMLTLISTFGASALHKGLDGDNKTGYKLFDSFSKILNVGKEHEDFFSFGSTVLRNIKNIFKTNEVKKIEKEAAKKELEQRKNAEVKAMAEAAQKKKEAKEIIRPVYRNNQNITVANSEANSKAAAITELTETSNITTDVSNVSDEIEKIVEKNIAAHSVTNINEAEVEVPKIKAEETKDDLVSAKNDSVKTDAIDKTLDNEQAAKITAEEMEIDANNNAKKTADLVTKQNEATFNMYDIIKRNKKVLSAAGAGIILGSAFSIFQKNRTVISLDIDEEQYDPKDGSVIRNIGNYDINTNIRSFY